MNDKEGIFITNEGAEKLRNELKYLKDTARQELALRLRAAISMGDLSENADYHKAKEDQAFLEGRIMELEYLLRNAIIVGEHDGSREIVDIGARVTVLEQDSSWEDELSTEETITYTLVGVKEANPRDGKISHESPIGRALMGKRVGDEVLAQTPGGEVKLIITNIE